MELSVPGLPVERILDRSLIAPACGTGTLDSAQDESVFQSVKTTVEGLKTFQISGEAGPAKKISKIA